MNAKLRILCFRIQKCLSEKAESKNLKTMREQLNLKTMWKKPNNYI